MSGMVELLKAMDWWWVLPFVVGSVLIEYGIKKGLRKTRLFGQLLILYAGTMC